HRPPRAARRRGRPPTGRAPGTRDRRRGGWPPPGSSPPTDCPPRSGEAGRRSHGGWRSRSISGLVVEGGTELAEGEPEPRFHGAERDAELFGDGALRLVLEIGES